MSSTETISVLDSKAETHIIVSHVLDLNKSKFREKMNFYQNPSCTYGYPPFFSQSGVGTREASVISPAETVETSRIANENLQLKGVLATLTMKYKFAEDARKVMTRRNSVLMDDNQFLQQKLLDAEKRRILAERESIDRGGKILRLETTLKELLSDGLEETRRKKKNKVKEERSTSTTDLLLEEEVQVEEVEDIQIEPIETDVLNTNSPTVESILELKDVLEKREETVSRIYERDRVNRTKIASLTKEIERLRNTNNWKATEIEYKTRDLKMKTVELADAKKELLALKHKLLNKSMGKFRVSPKKKIEKTPPKKSIF